MAFPQAGNLFDDLKDRIQQRMGQSHDNGYDDYYDDGYESGDYGPDGFDPNRYGSPSYDEGVGYRSARGSYDADSYGAVQGSLVDEFRQGQDDGYRMPRLVTKEEAAASASSLGVAAADRAREAADRERHAAPTTSFAAVSAASSAVSSAVVAPASEQESETTWAKATAPTASASSVRAAGSAGDAAQSRSTERSGVSDALSQSTSREPLGSAGLNGLFEPTTAAPTAGSAPAAAREASSRRELVTVRPHAYRDVEEVASILKAGNVAIIDLRATEESLAKRLLDFSFGVASALDAQVEAPFGKVYALCVGQALTAIEKRSLHQQGIR